ncbi:MAG: hypothetical protein QNJ64_01815 [Crocosphaera sp.]|nr:hypothetical protein [Crocosphaera sp.]
MNNNKYIKRNASSKKQDEGMSLLALLFFMMGAVNVYGHLQGSDNQVTTNSNNDMGSLFKIAVFAMFLAAIIEVFVI